MLVSGRMEKEMVKESSTLPVEFNHPVSGRMEVCSLLTILVLPAMIKLLSVHSISAEMLSLMELVGAI